MANSDYLEGVRAAQMYYSSPYYAGLVHPVLPEDAARLFLPPVTEYLTQVWSPLPPARQDWIRGFEEEQANILDNKQNDC